MARFYVQSERNGTGERTEMVEVQAGTVMQQRNIKRAMIRMGPESVQL